MKKLFLTVLMMMFSLCFMGCGDSNNLKDEPDKTFVNELVTLINDGDTSATDVGDRVIIVDTRDSDDYIEGHIADALNVPYSLISEDDAPLYTNGWNEVSTIASTTLADSWLTHFLVNQLVNDFASTYEDNRIIFYGENGRKAAILAAKIGYANVSYLNKMYEYWAENHGDLTEEYFKGVESVDQASQSFVFTGSINDVNYANVSTRGTHHGVTYSGGCLASSSFLWADIAPFGFAQMLTYLEASPEGNMADGIYYGDMTEWQSKFPDGQEVVFEVTWDGAARYYTLDELYTEQASEFDTDPGSFAAVGIESRIGGTRDSNLNWNPGCIFCFYACVCGITSNATANEDTWFADGGIYDVVSLPDDERNYYAGRYYPNLTLFPASGEEVQIKVTVVPVVIP